MSYDNEQQNQSLNQSLKKDFELVFRAYSNTIYRLCFFKTSSKDVAYDMTQETFLRFWKTLSSGKEVDKPKQYIYQIARNLIVDYYKSKKTVSLDLLEEAGFEPTSKDLSQDLFSEVVLLKEAINSLEDDFREVMYLRFIEELKVKEIAEVLNISENLVSVRINRGKKKLKEKFT